MNLYKSFVVALCVAVPLPLFADFEYRETTKITGGSVLQMMKFAGALSKESRQMSDPITSTVLVKGNQMNFKVNVRNTGAAKQVTGLDATESILSMALQSTNNQSGEKGSLA